MRILGIDPMTSMGWSIIDFSGERPELECGGVWSSKSAQELHGDVGRWLPMRIMLDEHGGDVDAIAIEKVEFQNALWSAHMYGGHRATCELWCFDNKKPLVLVPVATGKKALTGNGHAKKAAMLAYAKARFPGQGIRIHDQADAIGIALGAAKLLPPSLACRMPSK